MWLGKQVAGTSGGYAPFSGQMLDLGGTFAVTGAAEYRAPTVTAPWGICYRPPAGTQAVLIPAQNGVVYLGVRMEAEKLTGLQEGELLLYSSGGASVRLTNDGRVLINGRAPLLEEE